MNQRIGAGLVIAVIAMIALGGALIDTGHIPLFRQTQEQRASQHDAQAADKQQQPQPAVSNEPAPVVTQRDQPPATEDGGTHTGQGYSEKGPLETWVPIVQGVAAAVAAIATVVLARLARAQYRVYRGQLRIMHQQALTMRGQHDIMKGQLGAVTDQVRLARDEFNASHPPKIIVRRVSLDEGSGSVVSGISRPWKIQYVIANTGLGRATIYEGNATVAVFEKGLPAIPPFDDDSDIACPIALDTGESTPTLIDLPKGVVETAAINAGWDQVMETVAGPGGNPTPNCIYFFGYIQYHYCPEFSERTDAKCLTDNGFSTILGGVGLKLMAVCPTLFGGGSADERRKDAVLAADGLPTLEHIHADRRALSW